MLVKLVLLLKFSGVSILGCDLRYGSLFFCSNLANNLVSASYLTGNWKWFNKSIANSLKEEYLEQSSSMYHFAADPGDQILLKNSKCSKSLQIK
jgi:hypothetical protein